MKYNAYAKINLRLNVLGKNEFNYHNLSMLNAKISLADELEIIESTNNEVEYSVDSLNSLENDICLNVLNELIDEFKIKKRYHIYIKKNIPLGAGLGGGSSDVACIINAISELNKLNLTIEEKIKIGIKYGADVPYCLVNDISLVEGIGEKITSLGVNIDKKVIVVNPNLFVSTKEVFQNVTKYSKGLSKDEIKKLIYNKEYDKLLINDLEEPSFKLNEELKHIKESLLEYGNVVMSGSGSTMLILTEDSDCITKIKDKYPTYLIKETYIIK